MVESLPPPSATAEVADTPSHSSSSSSSSSSAREKLDVPEHGSSLSARLTLLNLDSAKEKQQQRLARDACSQPHPSASTLGRAAAGEASSGQRSGWGLGQAGLQQKQEGSSLMEQMMEEAAAAKEEEKKAMRKTQQRETKTTFAKGLKKGFLAGRAGRGGGGAPASSTASRKSKTGGGDTKKAPKRGSSSSSNSNGGVSLSSSSVAPAAGGKESMPVITGRTTASSGGLEFDVSANNLDATKKKNSLVLPEVQAAMESSTNPLGGGAAAGGGGGGAGGWLTPELLDKISKKPRLAAMLNDPRFSKAMQVMATSPKDALGMFASNPEARDTFAELTALLADHFKGMGVAADKRAEEEEADRKRVADGPLAQEAIRKAAEGVGVGASPATGEEKARVDSVLQQPELRELLMDPGMQRVLQECGEPSSLARYMRHPEFGPKLQLMARAGLVSFS
ncbi:unnamed protein product [Laminaria digitata]